MLNDKLNKYSIIFDKEGLAFFVRQLESGFSSIGSFKRVTNLHVGKFKFELQASLLLFQSMNLIEIDDKGKIVTKKELAYLFADSDRMIVDNFRKLFIDFVLAEGIIRFKGVNYSDQLDSFLLPNNSIRLSHSCYRNLLVELKVLSLYSNYGYIISKDLQSRLEAPKHRKKVTQEQLLAQLEAQEKQGEDGEEFVVSYEKERLMNHHKVDAIKRISPFDVSAGYDIVSFMDNNSDTFDRFIEVKTYRGAIHFHWSQNEIEKAKIYNIHYFLYLVCFEKIDEPNYKPFIIQDPIEFFKKDSNWIFEADSFTVKKINGGNTV